MSRFVSVGRVVKPKGLRGEMKVILLASDAACIEGVNPLYLESNGRRESVWIERLRPEGKGFCLKLRGLDNCEAAETWRNAHLEVEEERLNPPPKGSYYHFQLLGCAVKDAAGNLYGTVEEVESLPSCDALVLSLPSGDKKMVPLVKHCVLSVNLTAREITVDVRVLEETV